MRVTLVIYGSLDTLSGGYLYDRMLVRHLSAHGHSVEILSLPWRNYARHLGDNLSRAWLRRLQSCRADILLQDELNHPSLAFVNARLPQAARPPIVTLVHHLRSSEDHPALLRPLYRAIERRYLRSVDAFIFNSATTQAAVEKLAGRRGPALIAYPSASHLPMLASLSLHESPAFSAHASPLQLLFVGNLSPRKNLHTVLAALAQTQTPAHLHVIGSETVDPPYVRKIRAQLARLSLADRVTFHGRASDAALRALYAACQLLILPSYEGFGIVYLEAMAHGLPVIASTTGAAHEMIADGENGYLVDPQDAAALAARINLLTAQPDLRVAMAHAARSRFETFPTWEQSCAHIATFLEQLIR